MPTATGSAAARLQADPQSQPHQRSGAARAPAGDQRGDPRARDHRCEAQASLPRVGLHGCERARSRRPHAAHARRRVRTTRHWCPGVPRDERDEQRGRRHAPSSRRHVRRADVPLRYRPARFPARARSGRPSRTHGRLPRRLPLCDPPVGDRRGRCRQPGARGGVRPRAVGRDQRDQRLRAVPQSVQHGAVRDAGDRHGERRHRQCRQRPFRPVDVRVDSRPAATRNAEHAVARASVEGRARVRQPTRRSASARRPNR